MSRVLRALSLAARDPRLFLDKALFRARDLGPAPAGVRVGRVGAVRFEFDFGFDAAVCAMSRGGYETASVRMLRRLLKPGDVFVDAGANIGYMSAVAMGAVGRDGEVHAFEPVPDCFRRLLRLGELNPGRRFLANACALGEGDGAAVVSVTRLPNRGWNTMVPGFMKDVEVRESVSVPVRRLDRYLAEHAVARLAALKIDVEGYEFPVLRGMTGFLDRTAARPPILCEVAPDAYPLLGRSLREFDDFLRGYGYQAREIERPHMRIDLAALRRTTSLVLLATPPA